MSRGDEIEDAYEHFGSNQNDVVMIAVNCVPSQTKQQMISAYGFTPKFPIILGPQGKEISDEFGNPMASGGPTWIFHPKKEQSKATYHQDPALINDIQSAIDDDCNDGIEIYTLVVNLGTGDGDYMENTSVSISSDPSPLGKEFDKWIGDVQYIADPNKSTTEVVMPAQNIEVTATYKNKEPLIKKDNYMVISSWEGAMDTLGSSITIDSSNKADTVLVSKITLGKSDETNKNWVWAQITGYADGDFTSVTTVEITYSSDAPVYVSLDQEGLSDEGASYQYLMPASSEKQVKLSLSDFAQPDWVATDNPELVSDLDMAKIQSVSFAAINEEATVNLELQGIYLEGFQESTPVIKTINSAKNNSLKIISLSSGKLVVSSTKKDMYDISIFNVSGKKVMSNRHELSGNAIIDLKSNNLVSGAYIVKIKSNDISIVSNQIIR